MDGDFPNNSRFLSWYQDLTNAYARMRQPIAMDPNTHAMLEHVGFVDITHQEIKAPFNSWPPSGHDQEIGKWLNLVITQGLHAMTYAPFTRILGYAKDEVDAMLEEVKMEVCDRNLHTYCILWVLCATLPIFCSN